MPRGCQLSPLEAGRPRHCRRDSRARGGGGGGPRPPGPPAPPGAPGGRGGAPGRAPGPLPGGIRALGVEAAEIRADVTRPADVKRLVAGTVRRFGRLDLLVNNAGIFFRTALAETTPAQWDRLLNVNLRGPFLLSQAAGRVMEQSGGRIVNIGDVGGIPAC